MGPLDGPLAKHRGRRVSVARHAAPRWGQCEAAAAGSGPNGGACARASLAPRRGDATGISKLEYYYDTLFLICYIIPIITRL